MLGHPSRIELFKYVEEQLDGRIIRADGIAAHIVACERCAEEAARIRATLLITAEQEELEPSGELTARILMNARMIRTQQTKRRSRIFAWRRLQTPLAAAAVLMLGAFSFGHAFMQVKTEPVLRANAALKARVPDAGAGVDMNKALEDVRTLAASLDSLAAQPANLSEWRYRRTAGLLSGDLQTALTALKRNPGCERASEILKTDMLKQADALRKLYFEREF